MLVATSQTKTLAMKTVRETINNLPGSMLLASAELNHERSLTIEDDEEPAKKKPEKKAEKPKRNWVNTNLASDQAPWIPANAHMDKIKAKRLSPLGYFKLLFDDELIDLIVVETNRYASQKNRKFMATKNDINCFTAVTEWVRFNAQTQTNVGKCVRYLS